VVCSAGTMTTAYGNYNRLRRTAGTATTGYLYWGQFEGTWAGDKWGIWTNAATRNQISGSVTMPNQPFFTGSPRNTTGVGVSNAMFTVTNVGMSVSGGRITVPVAGKYLITFNTISGSSSGRVDANILVNGAAIVNLLSEDNGIGFHQKSGSIVRSLSENDYVEFNNNSWYNPGVTTFEAWRTCSVIYLG
jgi:hypothetical protein